MSRSRKKTPVTTCVCCKSQKKGKQKANHRFRRHEHVMIQKGIYDNLPLKSIELTSPWDLGGDGKCYWGFDSTIHRRFFSLIARMTRDEFIESEKEWFAKIMRK